MQIRGLLLQLPRSFIIQGRKQRMQILQLSSQHLTKEQQPLLLERLPLYLLCSLLNLLLLTTIDSNDPPQRLLNPSQGRKTENRDP
jgi:hypothetical protein